MGVPGQIGFIVDSICKQKTRLHVMHVQVQVHMSICLHLYTHTYDRLPSSSSAVKVRKHHVRLPSASLLLPAALAAASPSQGFAGSKGCVLPVSSPVFPFRYHTGAICHLVLFSVPCSMSHRHCLPQHFALPF